MPELPEVERVRLSLEAALLGRRVEGVAIHRADVIQPIASKKAMPAALLLSERVRSILRHGKQLAIVADGEGQPEEQARCICVHLGMTGSLIVAPSSSTLPPAAAHTHVTWQLDNGSRLTFRDPRRFGGIWTFPSLQALKAERWRALGNDALFIAPASLHEVLRQTSRSLKAALLDQQLIAGLGNIYVDELLFELGLHPMMPARRLRLPQVEAMVSAMRALLNRAIGGGGSSLRDYVDGNGQAGQFQLQHQVYGRSGKPCLRCASPLRSRTIAGRTTVFCRQCQRRSPGRQALKRDIDR
ncbi:MAG: bifunctional DNA-formamidopyrimidine glycosylase/DNA-(apurinic or apyrimidinic site) lyase [Phycisphaeraceae bacterium]